MKQEMVGNNSGTDANDGNPSKPLSLSEAIWQLPLQYVKVLSKPSVRTFQQEKGKASWGIVFLQFSLLLLITVALSSLAHFIPDSTLHTITAMPIGSTHPFHLLPSPYNGMTFILASFLIGLGTAYLFSKLWQGQGTLLAHTYCLLLCTVPLVTISGLLLVFPATGSLVAVLVGLVCLFFVYRMILHGFTIMAVHGLSGGRATLIVLIIPMMIAAIALIVGLIFLGGGDLFDAFDFLGSGGRKSSNSPVAGREKEADHNDF